MSRVVLSGIGRLAAQGCEGVVSRCQRQGLILEYYLYRNESLISRSLRVVENLRVCACAWVFVDKWQWGLEVIDTHLYHRDSRAMHTYLAFDSRYTTTNIKSGKRITSM